MDITEKAKNYAEGKAIVALEQLIADAYADGYKAGYQDRDDEIPAEFKQDEDVEFVDLDLPSGTKWAKDFLRNEHGHMLYLPYREAKKYSLPTLEQLKELYEHCKTGYVGFDRKSFIFLSRTGEKISLSGGDVLTESKILGNKGALIFWLNEAENDDHEMLSCYTLGANIQAMHFFIGYKLPVLLVKQQK